MANKNDNIRLRCLLSSPTGKDTEGTITIRTERSSDLSPDGQIFQHKLTIEGLPGGRTIEAYIPNGEFAAAFKRGGYDISPASEVAR